MAVTLPRRQAEVMAFIKAEILSGRSFPTSARIRDHMGWKDTNAASDVCVALGAKGCLRVRARTSSGRSWRYEWELVEGA